MPGAKPPKNRLSANKLAKEKACYNLVCRTDDQVSLIDLQSLINQTKVNSALRVR